MDGCDKYYVCDDCEALICGFCARPADHCCCATPVRTRIAQRIAARRSNRAAGTVPTGGEEGIRPPEARS